MQVKFNCQLSRCSFSEQLIYRQPALGSKIYQQLSGLSALRQLCKTEKCRFREYTVKDFPLVIHFFKLISNY